MELVAGDIGAYLGVRMGGVGDWLGVSVGRVVLVSMRRRGIDYY